MHVGIILFLMYHFFSLFTDLSKMVGHIQDKKCIQNDFFLYQFLNKVYCTDFNKKKINSLYTCFSKYKRNLLLQR